ncbi:MFS transporter [Flagellimonas sp. DF-77]|uniref:MFS transporter n=1 Tax=Flagellimonas algarum TaxID=3230298 RepID=UPI0033956BBA
MPSLLSAFDLQHTATGTLTASVQFGFIAGTLLFAMATLTDRFAPARVFLICALLGSCCNLALLWPEHTLPSLWISRFFTGFFLAGIYPVGMKIASDYFEKGLGTSLGYLVGALVLGTAFPHLLKFWGQELPWQTVVQATSALAAIGGLLLWALVPNGPYRKSGAPVQWNAFLSVFKNHTFRSAAFGYFGHMWELYAFWTFIPWLLQSYNSIQQTAFAVSFWSFAGIACGALACVLAGYLGSGLGTKKVARTALLLSGCCCLLCPLLFQIAPPWLFLSFFLFWGMVVIADSPLFATLVAQNAPLPLKGTALTIVNGIGFTITIVSIELLSRLLISPDSIWWFALLALGPVFGCFRLFSDTSRGTT